jgi:hypothetical protein
MVRYSLSRVSLRVQESGRQLGSRAASRHVSSQFYKPTPRNRSSARNRRSATCAQTRVQVGAGDRDVAVPHRQGSATVSASRLLCRRRRQFAPDAIDEIVFRAHRPKPRPFLRAVSGSVSASTAAIVSGSDCAFVRGR